MSAAAGLRDDGCLSDLEDFDEEPLSSHVAARGQLLTSWRRYRLPLAASGALAVAVVACFRLGGRSAGARGSGWLRTSPAAAPGDFVQEYGVADSDDCLAKCYGVSGHCNYCPAGEACCSKADEDSPSNPLECRGAIGHKTNDQYECVTAADVTLSHWQQDCWYACGGHSGFCDWCGDGNACCRAEWAHTEGSVPECDEAVGFRTSVHECVHAGWVPGAPAPPPYPVPALGAACSLHPDCEGIQGDCCPPVEGGTNLGCCFSPTPAPTDPHYQTELPAAGGTYACSTNWLVEGAAQMDKKGLCVDDHTLEWCPGEIPLVWPNSNQTVRSIRLFRAWADHLETDRQDAWKQIKRFVDANKATVLLGSAVSCNTEADEKEWQYTLDLMRYLGPQAMMGLAIGNEVELLQFKSKQYVDDACVHSLWEGGDFIRIFKQRVADMDALGEGFRAVRVTSVLSSFSLRGERWRDEPTARVDPFMVAMNEAYGQRFAYTINMYPYFDTSYKLEWNGDCWVAVNSAVNFLDESMMPTQARAARDKMWKTTGRYDDTLWIGETGWSWPMSTMLGYPMNTCPDFSSEGTFRKFYANFLQWDLTLGERMGSPDHVFYFTVHDSVSFGLAQHFGLIADCRVPMCKLQAPA